MTEAHTNPTGGRPHAPPPEPSAAGERVDTPPVLEIQGLETQFTTPTGVAKVLDGLDLALPEGKVTGLVGESGSGKSVTAYSVMRLIRKPGRIVGGRILFDGRDLLALSEAEMARVRGDRISMIFQQPRASLNPVFKIERTLMEVLRVHRGLTGRAAKAEARKVLADVGLPDPEHVLGRYPHQLSGGMCQRVMIALAISCTPRVLLADEPTTALDVTVQFQIIQLLQALQAQAGLSQLLITHDLGLVAELCDRVAVMYAGEIVEHASAEQLFDEPAHPYTKGLLDSRPTANAQGKLYSIPGTVPDLVDPPTGCRFHPRCPHAQAICVQENPQAEVVSEGHWVRCHFWREIA